MENYPKKEDKYWVLERKIVFLILFFKYCVVLTWKIVVPPKASVLYIYIDNNNNDLFPALCYLANDIFKYQRSIELGKYIYKKKMLWSRSNICVTVILSCLLLIVIS